MILSGVIFTRRKARRFVQRVGARVRSSSAFTLVELVLVIALVGVISTIVIYSMGTFSYWKDEAFVRKISETIVFLHHQAVSDQAFYRLEINFEKDKGQTKSYYSVGVMRPEEDDNNTLKDLCGSEAGVLSCELASFLSPSLGKTQTVIPPPDYPSLAERVYPPEGVYFEDIRTMRGKVSGTDPGKSFIMFSPRGFSEFAVLHLRLSGGAPVTILVNPFTGTTDIFREYKDFEWKYGRKESKIKA